MERIKRRNFDKSFYNIKNKCDILDLIDNNIKLTLRINDDEYNHLCDVLTDDEIKIFTALNKISFNDKRNLITILKNKLT